MPGLVGGAREGDVEADFDDPVVGPEHRLADGDEPGMGGDVDEAADPLRMDLDIPALRAARQRAAGHLPRLLEQRPISSRIRSTQGRGKAPLRAMMPSP